MLFVIIGEGIYTHRVTIEKHDLEMYSYCPEIVI